MPHMSSHKEVHLDIVALDRLRLTLRTEEAFRGLLQEFLTSSKPLMRHMEAGGKSVELAAHTLKSMARLIGAEALAEACRAVEFAAHGPRAEPVPRKLVGEVALHLRKAQEALERLLE